MKRSHVLLSSLAAILVVALFWFFAYQPQREALAEVEERIAAEEQLQAQLQAEIARLRAVRTEAPEIEAQLVSAQAIVPREAALPASLRQMQVAADESGVVLNSVSTGRPAQVEGGPEGLSRITVNVHVLGSYFQVVDFLRRIEDPTITSRGLLWTNAALSVDEYPTLNVNLTGDLYAAFEVAPPEAPEGEADAEDGAADDAVDGEDDEAPVDDAELESAATEVGR